MENQRDFKILNGFILKIMAIVFMTIDHIGLFMANYENLEEIAMIFRIIGRLSFPLIIFLLVEGIRHTKDVGKYFFRLGLVALVFLIGQVLYYYLISAQVNYIYSPAIDLLLTGVTVYLLKRKDKWSYLAVLPVAWCALSLVAKNYEMHHLDNANWMPFFLRPDYSIFGPLLGIAFYYSYELAPLFLRSNDGTKDFVGTSFEQTTSNLISAILLVILTLAIWFFDRYLVRTYFTMPFQVYALFAAVPIIFYSGTRGYNAKWFQYGCYIYFPVHFIIIYLIFALI